MYSLQWDMVGGSVGTGNIKKAGAELVQKFSSNRLTVSV
jgi:hypothetical protein